MFDGGWSAPVVRYNSADPILRVLRSGPMAAFGKPFAGYLLFLFGSADTEVVEWMRSHLVALDSLTGSDVAGVVFAKEVEVVVIGSCASETSKLDNVDLQHINYCPTAVGSEKFSPLMQPNGEAIQRTITAITRGTDEVARALDVVKDLPCVVVMDVADSSFEVIRITRANQEHLISVLRDGISRFHKLDHAKELVGALRDLEALGPDIEGLDGLRRQVNWEREARTRSVDRSLLNCLSSARQHLVGGSARLFIHRLRELRGPYQAVAGDAAARASAVSSRLSDVSQTITSILRAMRPEVSLSDREARLERIFRCARNVLAEIDGQGRDPTRTVASLRALQEKFISEVWGDLPDVGDLEASYRKLIAEIDQNASEQFAAIGAKEESLRERQKRAKNTVHLRKSEFRSCMMEALAQHMESHERATSKEAIDMVLSFLRPSIRGDLYVGVNVGAMGRNATVGTVDFRNDP